jgi:hypothetical protein
MQTFISQSSSLSLIDVSKVDSLPQDGTFFKAEASVGSGSGGKQYELSNVTKQQYSSSNLHWNGL